MKEVYEIDMDIEKLTKYAALAGISVAALKTLISKYKRNKTLTKFGKINNKVDIQDILTSLGEAPWKIK